MRDGHLHFARCRELTLVVCAATDYLSEGSRGFRDATLDPLTAARRQADIAIAVPPQALLHTHVADHRQLFDTMSVDLGASTTGQRAQDSWSRLKARAAPAAAPDPELEALYLQYGRYLTIAGSRDSLPTHLQGLWLADNTPPWSGDYHSDVNLQMNYWLPDRAGLGTCFEPLTAYCLAQVASWTEITQRLFNDPRNHFRNSSGRVDGWTVAISTNPFGGNGWWWHPAGSAWLCNSLWQHVEYTHNPADAQRILPLPLLRGACAFWQARLVAATVAYADGRKRDVLLADADWSPEHGRPMPRASPTRRSWSGICSRTTAMHVPCSVWPIRTSPPSPRCRRSSTCRVLAQSAVRWRSGCRLMTWVSRSIGISRR